MFWKQAVKMSICCRCGLLRFLTMPILFSSSVATLAADLYWQVSSGNWSAAANWGGAEPATSDYAYINNGGTATITQFGEICDNLRLGDSSTDIGVVEMTGGSLSAYLGHVGYYGMGTFTQTGGTSAISDSLILGYYSGANGKYDLSGAGELYAGYENVGYYGAGTFTQTAGTNSISENLSLGIGSGSTGTYKLSSTGQLIAHFEEIGFSGTGAFTQTGGTNSVSSNVYLGRNAGSTGTYDLSGTGQLSAKNEFIGYYGSGTLTQTAGMNAISSVLRLGYWSGSAGTYNLSGTGQLFAGNEFIGYYGTGTVTQTGGTNSVVDALYLGYSSNGKGAYVLNGGTLILKSISKGAGTAAFNFGGGTLQASGDFTSMLPITLTGEAGNAKIDSAGYTVALSGMLSGAGGLNKLGPGMLMLTQHAAYTGDTTVEEGTLDAVNIDTPNAAVSVMAGRNSLIAQSITSNMLTVGAGAMVVIKPIADAGPSGNINAVPEPSIAILAVGTLILLLKEHKTQLHF